MKPRAATEAVMMTGLDAERVLQALEILTVQPWAEERVLPMVADYQAPGVSEKVARIIVSYTDYINQKVWYKPIS